MAQHRASLIDGVAQQVVESGRRWPVCGPLSAVVRQFLEACSGKLLLWIVDQQRIMRDCPHVVIHVMRTAIAASHPLVDAAVDGERPFVVDLETSPVRVLMAG